MRCFNFIYPWFLVSIYFNSHFGGVNICRCWNNINDILSEHIDVSVDVNSAVLERTPKCCRTVMFPLWHQPLFTIMAPFCWRISTGFMEWSALHGLSQVSVKPGVAVLYVSFTCETQTKIIHFLVVQGLDIGNQDTWQGRLVYVGPEGVLYPSAFTSGSCWAALFRISAGSEWTQTSEVELYFITWPARWNVFQICWLYFTYPSGKAHAETFWKLESHWTNALSLSFKADQSDFFLIASCQLS